MRCRLLIVVLCTYAPSAAIGSDAGVPAEQATVADSEADIALLDLIYDDFLNARTAGDAEAAAELFDIAAAQAETTTLNPRSSRGTRSLFDIAGLLALSGRYAEGSVIYAKVRDHPVTVPSVRLEAAAGSTALALASGSAELVAQQGAAGRLLSSQIGEQARAERQHAIALDAAAYGTRAARRYLDSAPHHFQPEDGYPSFGRFDDRPEYGAWVPHARAVVDLLVQSAGALDALPQGHEPRAADDVATVRLRSHELLGNMSSLVHITTQGVEATETDYGALAVRHLNKAFRLIEESPGLASRAARDDIAQGIVRHAVYVLPAADRPEAVRNLLTSELPLVGAGGDLLIHIDAHCSGLRRLVDTARPSREEAESYQAIARDLDAAFTRWFDAENQEHEAYAGSIGELQLVYALAATSLAVGDVHTAGSAIDELAKHPRHNEQASDGRYTIQSLDRIASSYSEPQGRSLETRTTPSEPVAVRSRPTEPGDSETQDPLGIALLSGIGLLLLIALFVRVARK